MATSGRYPLYYVLGPLSPVKVLFPAPGGPESPILKASDVFPCWTAFCLQWIIRLLTSSLDWALLALWLDSTKVMPRAKVGKMRKIQIIWDFDSNQELLSLLYKYHGKVSLFYCSFWIHGHLSRYQISYMNDKRIFRLQIQMIDFGLKMNIVLISL